MNLIAMIRRQKMWSLNTFGPGPRLGGILKHIRKELVEVEESPTDVSEWIDVAILALDGAWRSGATAEQIAEAWDRKQTKNENRVWPDWRLSTEDHPIEHDRTHDEKN